MVKNKGSDECSDNDDGDDVYRLIRGAPSYIVTRTSEAASLYRPTWLRQKYREEVGFGLVDPPKSTPQDTYKERTNDEVKFVVSLMIKKGRGNGRDFLPVNSPVLTEDSSSDTDASSLTPAVSTRSSPIFKVGDRVKYKNELSDTSIEGKGIITKVERQQDNSKEGPKGTTSSRYFYGIDSAAESVPGIERLISENIIRRLGFRELMEDIEGEIAEGHRHDKEKEESSSVIVDHYSLSQVDKDPSLTKAPDAEPIKMKKHFKNPSASEKDYDWSEKS